MISYDFKNIDGVVSEEHYVFKNFENLPVIGLIELLVNTSAYIQEGKITHATTVFSYDSELVLRVNINLTSKRLVSYVSKTGTAFL